MKFRVSMSAFMLALLAGVANAQTRIDMRAGVSAVQKQVSRDLVLQTFRRSFERPIQYHGAAKALREAHTREGLAALSRDLPLENLRAMILGESERGSFVPKAVIFDWIDEKGMRREVAFADVSLQLPREDNYNGLGNLATRRSGYEVVNRYRDDQCEVRRVRASELFSILNAQQIEEVNESDEPGDSGREPETDSPGETPNGGNDSGGGGNGDVPPPAPIVVPLPLSAWMGILGLGCAGCAFRQRRSQLTR